MATAAALPPELPPALLRSNSALGLALDVRGKGFTAGPCIE